MSKRILVVDDEKSLRLMLGQALTVANYDVITAINGDHALEKVKLSQPDLMFLDVTMSGVDGIEVLRRLRCTVTAMPVVLMTAHGNFDTAAEAMKLGAVDYLHKPFAPDDACAIAQRVLARQTLQTKVPAQAADACLEQAKALLNRRQFQEADAMLRRASELDTSNAEVLNLLGISLEMKGQLEEAGRYYRSALQMSPSYLPAAESLQRVTQWGYLV